MGCHVQALFDMNRRQTESVASAEQASGLLPRLLEYLRVAEGNIESSRRRDAWTGQPDLLTLREAALMIIRAVITRTGEFGDEEEICAGHPEE
jgi:hypothetical protein